MKGWDHCEYLSSDGTWNYGRASRSLVAYPNLIVYTESGATIFVPIKGVRQELREAKIIK